MSQVFCNSTENYNAQDGRITATKYGKGKRAQDVSMHFGLGTADAFGRLRTSEPRTLFDSKQVFDNQPLFWDDQEVSGGGTSSNYNSNQSSSSLAVSATTAGQRVRQTFQRFNYQPGKGMLVFLTGVLNESGGGAGSKSRIGYFDDDNGLFFEHEGDAIRVVRRTKTSGVAIDTPVEQENWNLDKLNGDGNSGITLDFSLTQIMVIEFEWLGVGFTRFGFVVDGEIIYCHQINNTNVLSLVYMSTPNLPCRYEIVNDGTGPAASLTHICSTVISEGGQTALGALRHADSGNISSLTAGTTYALLGLRLKSAYIGMNVLIENISALATSQNDKCHWELRFNPTVAGTFTYNDVTNSGVQVASGATANVVTGGIEVDGGYFTDSTPVSPTVPNALRLGAAIDGTVDEIVLCARPITNNITVAGSITWRELQ